LQDVHEQLETPIRNAEDTVVHVASLNRSTSVRRAGSMYHIAANTNMNIDKPATPQTKPISISKTHLPRRRRNRRVILLRCRGLQKRFKRANELEKYSKNGVSQLRYPR
jgi:hypothetical protein